MLELNDESVRAMAAPPLSGAIRLGVTEYFLPGGIASILARFARAFPGVQLEARLGLSGDLRAALAAGTLDAAIVRLGARDRVKPIWAEPQVWVAAAALEWPARGVVPLALLPEPCFLRAHALKAMRAMKRAHTIAFTGSGMRSLQAGIAAGLGVSILPRSSLTPGMRVLGGLPSPGRLEIGIVKGAGASAAILDALEASVRESLPAA
jgi:DNA-binding transcriptional LysR family regulator